MTESPVETDSVNKNAGELATPIMSHREISFVVLVAAVTIGLFVFLGINAEQLLLGWLYFPMRTIPRMTIDGPSVFVGSVGMVLFLVVLHGVAKWLNGSVVAEETVATHRWTLRSTLMTFAALLVLFAAGTSFVAAVHQLVWLASGRADASTESMSASEFGLLAQAREAARNAQAKNQLKEYIFAFHNFHDTYGAFPVGGTMSQDGELLHGWAIFIGPFHSYMAPDLDYSRSWRAPPNDRIYKCQERAFLNPSQQSALFDRDGFGLSHWAGNVHVLPIRTVRIDDAIDSDGKRLNGGGLTKQNLGLSLKQITDGTSNTILLGTVGQNFQPWGHPANVRDPSLGVNRSPDGFGGPPVWNGAMFAMCDGSVRLLSNETDLGVMKALATANGGEAVPEF
jgi:hypothetical protein